VSRKMLIWIGFTWVLASLFLVFVVIPKGMESGILEGHPGRSVGWYQWWGLIILLGTGTAVLLLLLWSCRHERDRTRTRDENRS
jgi:hypothetical protein